jgi:hypothetical protein
MATIAEKLALFDGIDVEKQAGVIIEQHPSQIIAYNQANLQEGMYKQGDFLAPYASKYYAALKLKLNPRGVTDLRLTGEYYRSMKLKVDQTTFTIYSDDEKADRLVNLYGDDILGISNDDKVDFANTVVQPGIVQYLKETLKL